MPSDLTIQEYNRESQARRIVHEHVSYVNSVALRTSKRVNYARCRIAHTQVCQPREHVAPRTSKCVYHASASHRAQAPRRLRKRVTSRTSGAQTTQARYTAHKRRADYASTSHCTQASVSTAQARRTAQHPRTHAGISAPSANPERASKRAQARMRHAESATSIAWKGECSYAK